MNAEHPRSAVHGPGSARASAPVASYELPLTDLPGRGEPETGDRATLPEAVLIRNVRWFCQLRWLVATFMVAFGLLSLFPGLFERFALRPHPVWPFVLAGVLVVSNLAFLAHAQSLTGEHQPRATTANLWAQIMVDLSALTAVVHFAGSLETYIAFAYLFHIVLACIFLSHLQGLVVTIFASGLYVACVAAEVTGLLRPAGIYTDPGVREAIVGQPTALLLTVTSAVTIWVVVWFLTSHLSALVRQRDHHLAEANRRLVAAQQERTAHMLQTTHELKAPFAAIHANTQLLLGGYCGELPPAAQQVALRIRERCRRLTQAIQEMLQLVNLRSSASAPAQHVELDLAELVRWAVDEMHQLAEERGITVRSRIKSVCVRGVEDQLRMLVVNLISNGVSYSHPGGRVDVECGPGDTGEAMFKVQDRGIGIQAEKLPRIFEEYYRTDEAARFNRGSSGLGLAIVRHVAESHRIRLRVDSAPGAGALFTLRFPTPTEFPVVSALREEATHGIPAHD